MDKGQDPSDQKKPSQFNNYLRYSGLAFQLVATIGVAGWIGHLLDNFLELKYPVFILILTILAFAGSLYQLFRSLNQP